VVASRPSFEEMQKAYPKGIAAKVKESIGGKMDAIWITNTCVIRDLTGLELLRCTTSN